MTTIERYTPDLSPERIEQSRTLFADAVIGTAIECRNNQELIDRLSRALPNNFLCHIDTGSTRRVYTTPLGVCIKVQREHSMQDPLTDAELEARGGKSYLHILDGRRRTANLSEILFATARPLLMPRQYGFLGSFGIVQQHPSVIIAETARPLNRFFPHDGKGVHTNDIGIDADGFLQIFDGRITPMTRPAHLRPYRDERNDPETEVWLGNLAVTVGGKFVFVDRSDHGNTLSLLNEWTLNPREWGWTLFGSSTRAMEFSRTLFERYQQAWDAATKTKGEPEWEKEAVH